VAPQRQLAERRVAVLDPRPSRPANSRFRPLAAADSVPISAGRELGEPLSGHRWLLVATGTGFVLAGALLTLMTGSLWFLPLACGLHAIGTLAVVTIAVRETIERAGQPPPAVAQWSTLVGLSALSIVLPVALGGGLLWLLAAVLVPTATGGVAIQTVLRSGEIALQRSRRSVVWLIPAATATAVAAFSALVALTA
jgi:hypothetical protein